MYLRLMHSLNTEVLLLERELRALAKDDEDVKLLIEGKIVRSPDGTEVRIWGIPHRVLTSATGAELYPAYYANRPEGKTKIYTLYAFDFGEVANQTKRYLDHAMALFSVE